MLAALEHKLRHTPGMAAGNAGGEGWIRTSVRLRGQIYSLLPLTTRPPLQMAGRTSLSRRAKWPRWSRLSMRGGGEVAHRKREMFCDRQRSLVASLRRSKIKLSPGQFYLGAGEGNRTLVVSLEGFCSTIELHPQLAENLDFWSFAVSPFQP